MAFMWGTHLCLVMTDHSTIVFPIMWSCSAGVAASVRSASLNPLCLPADFEKMRPFCDKCEKACEAKHLRCIKCNVTMWQRSSPVLVAKGLATSANQNWRKCCERSLNLGEGKVHRKLKNLSQLVGMHCSHDNRSSGQLDHVQQLQQVASMLQVGFPHFIIFLIRSLSLPHYCYHQCCNGQCAWDEYGATKLAQARGHCVRESTCTHQEHQLCCFRNYK